LSSFFVKTFLLKLNALSLGALDAGTLKIPLASLQSLGNLEVISSEHQNSITFDLPSVTKLFDNSSSSLDLA